MERDGDASASMGGRLALWGAGLKSVGPNFHRRKDAERVVVKNRA